MEIVASEKHYGLAVSVINGVSFMLEKYENVIVMEDDLIASPNFLDFMNQALTFYENDKNIQSINGYSLELTNKNRDIYFQIRTGSWGWATWRDRWNPIIFNKEYLKELINSTPGILKKFNKKCGADMSKMLMESIANKIDSWYVRWTFDHFTKNHYAVSRIFIYNKYWS